MPPAAARAPASTDGRMRFIEGLKGVGALQVVVLHYISAFFPVMARFYGTPHYAWESSIAASPFFIFYDGFAAYNLFFLMSGFVLAPSFARISDGWLSQAARRVLRLFLPLAAAFFIAVALLLLFPHAKDQANAIAHSDWLANSENSPMTFAALAKDLFLNSMLLGYRERSIAAGIGFLNPYLTSWAQSVNGPFWTMHIILWGSLLLLCVAWLRQRLAPRFFYAAVAGVFLITGTGGFSLFIIGYLLYDLFVYLQNRGIEASPDPASAKPPSPLGGRETSAKIASSTAAGGGSHKNQTRVLRERAPTQPSPQGGRAFSSIIGAISLLAGLVLIDAQDFHALEPVFDLQNFLRPGPTTSNEWLQEVGATLIFIGVLTCAPVAAVLSARPLAALGRLSFSLYLTHFPLLFTVGCLIFADAAAVGYGQAFLITATAGIGLSLALAHFFERRVDVPAIALTKRLFSAQQVKAPRSFTPMGPS